MGLFNMHYDRPGPGVEKDAPRKKGIARWFEIVGRDLGDFTKANIITALCCLPCVLVVEIGLIMLGVQFHPMVMLLALLLASALGFLAGPALCAMCAVMLKRLRDEPCFFWPTYKKAFRENFRRGAFTGVIFVFALLLQAMALLLYSNAKLSSLPVLAILFLDVVVITMVTIFAIPQIVLMNLTGMQILMNSLRLAFAFLPRCLPAALVVLFLVGAQLLYPFLLLPVFLLVGVWLPGFTALFLIYKPLDQVFKIEEQMNERREREMRQLEAESQAAIQTALHKKWDEENASAETSDTAAETEDTSADL